MPSLRSTITSAADRAFAMLPDAAAVTVRSIDPDTGETLATAEGVTANRTQTAKAELPVGDGAVPGHSCRFRLLASEVPFELKPRDVIVEADGAAWSVTSAGLAVLRSRWVCEVTRHRT